MSELISLSGLTQEDIQNIFTAEGIGWEKYRAKQIHSWIYAKNSKSFDEWTNLSAAQRELLKEQFQINNVELIDRQKSKKDPTQKFLFKTKKGHFIESVLMRFKDRNSLSACISSQVGCAVGCPFCATGKLGFKDNLHYSEIADQIMSIQRITGERVDNIVYMGQGEPLNNYDNVVQSIEILRGSVGIGARSITLSTSGVVPKIIELGKTKLPIHLAISLHAPTQKLREVLVPVAKKWPLMELMEGLKEFYSLTKRRITFEYVLLKDVNDTEDDAQKLADLLRDLPFPFLINLIPYNSTGDDFDTPEKKRIQRFKSIAERYGAKTTVRVTLGDDIDAACGQLHNKKLAKAT